ncbi:MAG TPA: ABC transporter permease [Syntrophorhabdaceae bacterium]|nr:ABC transporter permease [Syntrophorhabdaceae bacterium]HPP05799.1 ABC transporter permease [Syntrophorhabdaceae bacterium]
MMYSLNFYLKIALQNLVIHKARMILALLGILFAVMSLVAFGNISIGMKSKIDSEISRFGKNLIILRSGLVFLTGRGAAQFAESKTLKMEDVKIIKERLSEIKEVVPFYDTSYPARYGENTLKVSIMGATPNIFAVRNIELISGRPFTDKENENTEKSAVVGFKVFDNLFKLENPIGKYILIYRVPTEIIGVIEEKGVDYTGQDQDLQVYIPLNTFMRRLSNVDYIKGAYFQTEDGVNPNEMKQKIRSLLRKIHNLKETQKDDFSIFTLDDILRTREEGIRLVSVLTIIASIVSFLIGGLGIFAIMLLSIAERKMEIGIRRVVGSKKKDIIFQFLTESVIVAMIGGIAGILVGCVITIIVDYFGGFPFFLHIGNIFLSIFISVLIGIAAGIYPAIQGTKFVPIEVLH